MTSITFFIRGNQNDPIGNPIPYKRTLRGVYSKVSKDYHEWLEYVRAEFARRPSDIYSLATSPTQESFPYPAFLNKSAHLRPDVSISCRIWWKDKKHGDVDNVLKGILDALFKNDKCVFGISAIATPALDGKGRVEVRLDFTDMNSPAFKLSL